LGGIFAVSDDRPKKGRREGDESIEPLPDALLTNKCDVGDEASELTTIIFGWMPIADIDIEGWMIVVEMLLFDFDICCDF
jgi:hypothetical protein